MALEFHIGDIIELPQGVGEVLAVTANSEGGRDLVLRVAERPEDLSLTVMREEVPE